MVHILMKYLEISHVNICERVIDFDSEIGSCVCLFLNIILGMSFFSMCPISKPM